MQKYILTFFLIFTFSVLPFGKNKVQYHKFGWQYIETEHFRVYFYEGGEYIARFCAGTAEKSYDMIKQSFLFELRTKVNIIVYNSHNHFQETNLSGSIPQESVGGFTEFFKTRVVVPFEGDWEKYRHVIHHELVHAVMTRMLFGQSFQSIVYGLAQTNMPLWFIEGLAEYESRGGWDTESDQYMRDAVYSGYVPDIPYLSNYLVYKGGQSLLYYISQTYGEKKIGDILRKISVLRSTNNAFREALGVEFDRLSEDWHRWLESKYWPTLVGKDDPEDVSVMLSDHREYNNFINKSPAISPDGMKVAFISNKSDYFDIYLMRTFDGEIVNKIVAGQSSGDFEELHWLMPGICWSADSRNIAFAAKAGDQDALYIFEAETGERIKQLKFGLDGIYAPDWSKSTPEICFLGLKDGMPDIYIYNLRTEELTKVTDDIWFEGHPKFSNDGSKIIFSSDRDGDNRKTIDLVEHVERDHNVSDIYTIDLTTKEIERVTDTPYLEKYPFWINENEIGYLSDANGVNNVYFHEMENGNTKAVTDLITGCLEPAYNNNSIVYTSLFEGGYDIFMIENVDSLKAKEHNRDAIWYETKFREKSDPDEKYTSYTTAEDVRKITFSRSLLESSKPLNKSSLKLKPYTETEIKDYEIKFTPDIITVMAAYASGYGVAGNTYMQFSDQLSNHQIKAAVSLNRDILNADAQVFYHYLPERINWGVGIAHNSQYFRQDDDEDEDDDDEIIHDRLLSLYLLADYPLSRYARFDTFFSLRHISSYDYDDGDETYRESNTVSMINFGYSYDNTIWGIVGPENGMRARVDLSMVPNNTTLGLSSDETIEFTTVSFDVRKYIRLSGAYQVALRLSGGVSEGKTPQQFLVGGTSSWLNWKRNGDVDFEDVSKRYYSSADYPLRGQSLYEKYGNRYGVMNVEFRYPLIQYLAIGFPLPMSFSHINGVMFSDLGTAFTDDNFKGIAKNEEGKHYLKDLLYSYGLGARAHLGLFILRYDVAWKWNFYDNPSEAIHMFSMGANF